MPPTMTIFPLNEFVTLILVLSCGAVRSINMLPFKTCHTITTVDLNRVSGILCARQPQVVSHDYLQFPFKNGINGFDCFLLPFFCYSYSVFGCCISYLAPYIADQIAKWNHPRPIICEGHILRYCDQLFLQLY